MTRPRQSGGCAHPAAPGRLPARREVPPSAPAAFLLRASKGSGVGELGEMFNPGEPMFRASDRWSCETQLTFKRPTRCGVGVNFVFK